MYKKLPFIIFPFLFALFVVGLVHTIYAQANYDGITPEHVILNLTETPDQSVAVTWRTQEPTVQYVQWVDMSDSPVKPDQNRNQKALSETSTYLDGNLPPFTVTNHSTIIQGLSPKSSYLYRVGNGNVWSEWFEFKTAGDKSDPISFLYMGDAQNSLKAHWSRVIRKAWVMAPDAQFIMYAGDLINRTDSELEWKEWFQAGDFIHATLPSMMTPGNHEYDGDTLDNHWRPQFTLPMNGPGHEALNETTYYVDYQDLRIITIDSDFIVYEADRVGAQALEWMEKVLAENDKKWTILMLHFPFYSTSPSRDNPELRQAFQPLLEKYNVDMVLAGHDHAYGRGMKNIASMTESGEISGPMYVVSVSGPKMYDLSDKEWMTRKAGNTQLFHVINIDNNRLSFKAYTASGTLYDEFDLIKRKGKNNKLVNKIPSIPERLYTR